MVLEQLDVSRETSVNNLAEFKQRLDGVSELTTTRPFATLNRDQFGFYPVVDSVGWVARLLELGVRTIQLRIKDPMADELEKQIAKSIQLGKEYHAQVFINDHWQLALKHGAFGIHLGQEDIQQTDLKQIRDSGMRLGVSTHSFDELLVAARILPSYIALGHIFPTTTKVMPSKPQGLQRLEQYQQAVDYLNHIAGTRLPTVAIGGIDSSNAGQVLACGVDSLAVVRAVTANTNWQATVQQFLQRRFSTEEVSDACRKG